MELSSFLNTVDGLNLLFCVLSLVPAVIYRDTRWFAYSFVIACFYSAVVYFHGYIRNDELDPLHIYRYAIWVGSDTLCVIFIFWLWHKKWIHTNQIMLFLVATIPMELLQFVRYVDKHFLPSSDITAFYQNLMPTLNVIIVASCWLPLRNKVKGL